jgi:DNA-binding NarL/FixJ family response regulator
VIRVLLVDDQPLVRTGLRGILRPEYGFEVVGECDDGSQVVGEVDRTVPDVVVMDVRMPGVDGATATRRLRARVGAPPVLVLTTFDDDETLSAALRAGAAGFLLKDAPAEDIHRAVARVAAGDSWLDPAVCGRVLAAYRRTAPADTATAALRRLTAREREVLALMGRGASNAEIAAALVVGEATVKTHVGSILSKLGLRDRPAAIVFAFDHGLVSPAEG